MSTSMVKGSPLKLMLRFALPLLIGNLLQQTYNIIDAAIVGQILGASALASVGASSSVQFLVLGFCMGNCAGFGVPIAKYFGAGNQKRMRDCVFNGAVLPAAIAVILTTACALLCHFILHILSVPSDIYAGAYQYLIVIFLGIPFTLMYNYLSSVLRSVGDSRTPFLFLAFSACLNIILDLFCIAVLHWGCMGAAIATVTAQAISGILCLVFITKKMPLYGILLLESWNFKCDETGHTGTRLFRQIGIFRGNGNDRQNCSQPGICRYLRLYRYLLCRSDSMAFCLLLYRTYLHPLHQKG